VTPLKAREVTAALRRYYPASVPVRSDASPDGPVLVRMGALGARYLGIGRDHAVAANLLGWHLGRPVTIASCDHPAGTDTCVFTVAADPGGPWPVHPGSLLAVPAYDTPAHVLGGQFPANRVMAGLIRLALEAGCRPHLNPWRSGHGRQYRVSLWHTDPDLLFGCIDASEITGSFAAAWLQWGTAPEIRYDLPARARAQLALVPGPAARQDRSRRRRSQPSQSRISAVSAAPIIHPDTPRGVSTARAGCQYGRPHAAGRPKEPAVTRPRPAAGPDRFHQHLRPGWSPGPDRELREVPATDQAIRGSQQTPTASEGGSR
jgi:hypothetical protein